MAKSKQRTPRTRLLGHDPIPVTALRGRQGDQSMEARQDGISGRGETGRRRQRVGSTEPLPLSPLEEIDALVCFAPLWEIADRLEPAPRTGRGRPRRSRAVEMLLFEVLTWQLTSFRQVERWLNDRDLWERLGRRVAAAWPDRPDRRLSVLPPTRSQHHHFRKTVLEFDDAVDELGALCGDVALNAAEAIGLFDPSLGSWTHPDTRNLVVGDGTFIPALYNTPPGTTVIDTDTGEILHPRCDPDAVAYHPGDNACGRMLVSAIARNPYPNERIVLDLDFKPASGKSDATVFTDMALTLAARAHVAGAVYDMALYPTDSDRLLTAGLHPVAKVQRTSSGAPARVNLGEHTFTRVDGTTIEVVVTAIDGAPTITIPTSDGLAVISLVRQQTKRRPNADGTHTVYGTWLVPHHPAVDKRLRGASVLVRHNSTVDEVRRNQPRTRALRTIPENDGDFGGLFGLREDVESMHHDFKRTLVNGRARCVGLHRQRINHHGYQLRTIVTALIAWHYRTSGDLDHWFGHWRPPPRRAAA